MSKDDIRHEWVAAVLENRLATAAYLEPGLPAPGDDGMVRPEDRESATVSGEIEND